MMLQILVKSFRQDKENTKTGKFYAQDIITISQNRILTIPLSSKTNHWHEGIIKLA